MDLVGRCAVLEAGSVCVPLWKMSAGSGFFLASVVRAPSHVPWRVTQGCHASTPLSNPSHLKWKLKSLTFPSWPVRLGALGLKSDMTSTLNSLFTPPIRVQGTGSTASPLSMYGLRRLTWNTLCARQVLGNSSMYAAGLMTYCTLIGRIQMGNIFLLGNMFTMRCLVIGM